MPFNMLCLFYTLYFKEMNLFENVVFFFYQPAELFPCFSQLREEKEHLYQKSYLHITFRNVVYVETLLFAGCINTIFHMNKIVFQILWTIIRLFL